jgi:hypothetical protein
MSPLNSGVLEKYTNVDSWFFIESYKVFGNKEELFKIVDGREGPVQYYVKTSFLTNQDEE